MRLLFAPTKPAVRRAKRHQSSNDSESINFDTPENSEVSEREEGQEKAGQKGEPRKFYPNTGILLFERITSENLSAG